jgi:ribosome-binding factor A
MTSTRQNKVARLLQKELGQIFLQESHLFGSKMITVTVVRVTPDLGLAKIYLSVFSPGDDSDPISGIQEHIGKIKNELGKRIRHQLRSMPELQFYLDDSLDYVDNIDSLLNN